MRGGRRVGRKRILILGAAGRDFHNFNVVYRDDPSREVVAFTATQIPETAGRRYPPLLSGPHHPEGIPIVGEEEMEGLIARERIDEVVFSYSDVSFEHVMTVASRALSAGADFTLLGPERTMLRVPVPSVAVCAVRTGCGKSQTTRRVCEVLTDLGRRPVVVRHPMPYGDLASMAVQRFRTAEDLDAAGCTIEEREEYEPHLEAGRTVFAGVDYAAIFREAHLHGDLIVWDGGNNDFPFLSPDLWITLLDPHRPGDESRYHPGLVNLIKADALIINKVDSAPPADVERVREAARRWNGRAVILEAASPVIAAEPDLIRGKRVLVVEDGPTLTHGDMAFGAGYLAAERCGAAEVVDPRPYAAGSIRETLERYPRLRSVVPAMGYSAEQVKELERTIEAAPCDAVVAGTPVDLRRVLRLTKPVVRVHYELQEIGRPTLREVLAPFAP
ncbi:MAG: GTPase [Candidatus Tectomicrobia bacterium]|nr:GTPase [Candidatus Tectomicrobia bacterium]